MKNVLKFSILDRYLAKQVIAIVLVVILALSGLDLFFNLVNELKSVGKGSYTLKSALEYLTLGLPMRLYMMFPWAALLGTLISLGMLANHSELIVMRTAGVSIARIILAALKAACILTVVMLFLGEGLAPNLEQAAQNKRTLALSGGQSVNTPYGLWMRQGNDYVHIKTLNSETQFSDLTWYQFEGKILTEVTRAARVTIKGSEWVLSRVQSTKFFPDHIQTLKKTEETVKALADTELLKTVGVKHPERMSLPALRKTIKQRADNELNVAHYELAFWQKMFHPLLIILMVFLAVPFVFGPLRTGGMGLRLVVGGLTVYLFHTLNGLFAPLAVVYQVPPFLAVLFPFLLFTGGGLILLRRMK